MDMDILTTTTYEVKPREREDVREQSYQVACAWCEAEQGVHDESASHGICADHAAQVYAAFRAKRAGRAA